MKRDVAVFLVKIALKVYMPGFLKKRVSKDKDSFCYLAVKKNKIRPKADSKAISEALSKWSLEAFQRVKA